MPLDAFIDEVMAPFGQQPTLDEIIVERARLQRLVERGSRFDQVFEQINATAQWRRARSVVLADDVMSPAFCHPRTSALI